MELERHVRAGFATIIGLILIPWLITDPHWRNVLLGFVGLYVIYVMTERHGLLKPDKKAVLITGCDSGFGQGMAQFFDNQGFRVFAGCLISEGEGAKSLQSTCSERLKVLQLDVTKDSEVEEALETVKKDLDGEGLWGLVNNAGILLFAEVELAPLRVFQQHFDVNCLGQVRMVKAFLPLIKRVKGRIINICSINARQYMSMFAPYDISKAGVEVFSDVLRLEMRKWGINVSTVFPAAFDTNMTKFNSRQEKYLEEIKESLSESQKQYYNDNYFKKIMERSTGLQASDDAFSVVSSDYRPIYHAVDHALLSTTPKARYLAGFGARFVTLLTTHSPSWFLDLFLTSSTLMYREKGLEPPTNMKFD